MKIAVIGAGLSGLTAAWELSKCAHDVLVLEARSRVGGRSWSEERPNGQIVERGGEFIFPDEFPIRRLASELKIPIMSHGVRYMRRMVDGRVLTSEELAQTMETVTSTVQAMLADGLTSVSLEQAFKESLGAFYRQDPAYRRVTTSAAANPELVSAEAVLLHEAPSARSHIEDGGRIVGGNQRLSAEIARRLGTRVRLTQPVASIDQSSAGVQVRTVDGTAYDADCAVLSVPLPILRTLQLGFPLRPEQQEALDHRIMGHAAKLAVSIDADRDDVAIQNAEHCWWSWRSLATDGSSRLPVISSFAGGEIALQALQTTNGSGTWLEALEEMRPTMRALRDPLLTTWSDDPWAMGAYSAPGLDWRPGDADAFLRLSGRVAIAGEHTGTEQSLSGAVASGYRAASAIGALSH